MPLYGLAYSAAVYQFAPDVAPKFLPNASAGRNREGFWGGRAASAAAVQRPRKRINLSKRSL